MADLDGLRLDEIDGGDTVRSLLAALPENERTVVLLRIFHSQRTTRIAERLGITPVDVTRLLATSLARLRDQLPQG